MVSGFLVYNIVLTDIDSNISINQLTKQKHASNPAKIKMLQIYIVNGI